MRRSILLAPVLAGAVLLAACGDTSSDDDAHMNDDHMDSPATSGSMGHGHDENSPVASDAHRVEVTADDFAFDPHEIRVGVGEDIAIVLTSEDLEHDFTIDELDAHVSAGKGDTAEGGFRAEEAGSYTYYCTVEGHREEGMEGTLVVE